MGMLRILQQFQSSARSGEMEKHGAVLVSLGNEDLTLAAQAVRVPMIQVQPRAQGQCAYNQNSTHAVCPEVNPARDDCVLVQRG